jgi:hypothetical protein
MTCPAIDNPASCEISAICSLRAKNMCAAEIYRELCAVYGLNVTSKGTVRQCVECFKMGEQMFTMKSEVVGHLQCLMILFKEWTRKFVKDGASQFHALYEINILRLGYHKFCTTLVPKILTRVHITQRMASA